MRMIIKGLMGIGGKEVDTLEVLLLMYSHMICT